MNKRLQIVIGFLLASGLGLLVWRASGRREPEFEGRTLTSWLDHHVATSAARRMIHPDGRKQLRMVGTSKAEIEAKIWRQENSKQKRVKGVTHNF